MLESDQLRENVRGGFRGLLGIIQRTGEQSRPDIEGKITVASETWSAGHTDLAISLLLDAFIKMYEEKLSSG
jgi:hypothetical protein